MAVTTGCQADWTRPAAPVDPSIVTLEPQETARFLATYTRGDEAAAEEIASPLYQAEWVRRGLPLAERQSLHPVGHLGFHVAFVGGFLGAAGFGHYLYLAAPLAQRDPYKGPLAVWRVDTDPAGRVIWLELVWRFSPDISVTATTGDRARQPAGAPAELQALRPEVLIRIQADTTRESYNLIRIAPANLPVENPPEGGVVAFYGTDEEGGIRPGVWSYGQPSQPTRAYGQGRPPSVAPLGAGLDALDLAYRASLLPGP
jgi:hypothetical protein